MANSTVPIFIVGSGRSGTRSFFKMLSGTRGVEVHHEYSEYAVWQTPKLSVLYAMGLIDDAETIKLLQSWHGSSVFYSDLQFWVDCSHKTSYLIKPLSVLFPEAKFLAIIRDGRKVVPSFYHKLALEMYTDKGVRVFADWLCNPSLPEPPPEKEYWWKTPLPESNEFNQFLGYSRFERVCCHWRDTNQAIINAFSNLPSNRTMTIRLEDVINSESALQTSFEFMGISYDSSHYAYLQKPRNVFMPLEFKLTTNQKAPFSEICGDLMASLGYADMEEFTVAY